MFIRIAARIAVPPFLLFGLAFLAACSGYQVFETLPYLEDRTEERLGPELAARVEIPFELPPDVIYEVEQQLSPAGSEKRRTEEILDFIFSGLELRYSLTPTRNAEQTYRSREGNCLSFVNLFVGIARHQRLNPFYVEVEDYQRWNFSEGVVLSRGHIVAGMTVDGQLSTFDFLPYRPKAYRDFKPIDDLIAMAHHYNNLGAEALIEGNLERARFFLEVAVGLAPDFEKAINNLGILHLRLGETERAVELYEQGLKLYPESVPLLTNLARVNQEMGRPQVALELLSQIEDVNQTNPFFFVYRGELALADGDAEQALEYMRQALRTDSEVPEVHVGLAQVFLALGDLERARHHVARALRLDATHLEARKLAALLAGSPTGG